MAQLSIREARKQRTYYLVVIGIYISIFVNSYVFFKEPFEFYLGYLIYILLLPGFIRKYGFNRNLVWIFLLLLITGVVQILFGNNTTGQFMKVYSGLLLSYFFYQYVFLEFDMKTEQLFKWYLFGSYIVALIGIVQFISFQVGFEPGYNYRWVFNKWGMIPGGNFGIRINSIFGEPTYLGAVVSAAFFVSLYNITQKNTYYLSKFKSSVIIVVYLLSFSGVGQVGIFLSVFFLALNLGFVRYIFLLIPAGILLFNVFYNNSKDFQERFDGMTSLFISGGEFKLGKTHGSSFILYNNYVVATENFKSHFLFGTGIGSHGTAFEKLSLARNFKVRGFNHNSQDANSMLLRLISETGIFGVGLFFFIIFRYLVRRNSDYNSEHWLVSNGILVMILVNLFRQGHYFLNGFPFFVLLYIYNHLNYIRFQEIHDSTSEGDISTVEGKKDEVMSI
jgi:hypothetical protein